ncbi:hypothetical protein ACROYT_G040810 [Oculina patagonica]
MLWFKVFLLPILSCCAQGLTVLPSSLSTLQQATVTKDWPPSLAIWPTPTFSASPSFDVSDPTSPTSSLGALISAVVTRYWPPPSTIRPTSTSGSAFPSSVSVCQRTFKNTTGEIDVVVPPYKHCSWTIRSPFANSSILLVVKHHKLMCRYARIEIRTGNGEYKNVYVCNQKEQFAVFLLDNYVHVMLYSYRWPYTKFKASYFAINNTASNAPYQHGWNVTVNKITSTAVDVSWLPLNTSSLNSTYIYGYVAVCLHNITSRILVTNLENASSSSTMPGNLKPYTIYRVKVFALVRDGITGVITLKSSKNIEIRTKEDVPGAVSWVYAYSRDSNSLVIKWSSIPEEDTHGVLLGYVVYFRRYNSNENFTIFHVNASTRVFKITDLMEATTYRIIVAGRTSVGEGGSSYSIESTVCVRNLSNGTGEISVTRNSYYRGYCNWEIHSPLMNSNILLVVEHLQMYCWYGSIISQGGQNKNFCGENEPFVVLILGSYVRVSMYGYDTALKARYFVMNDTGSDASYQHGWNVTVGNVNSTAVYVSWLPLNTTGLNSTDIYGYTAVPLHNVTNNIFLMNTSSSNAVVRNLRPYTWYRVIVVALVRDGVTGATTLKSSKNIDIRTQEDG